MRTSGSAAVSCGRKRSHAALLALAALSAWCVCSGATPVAPGQATDAQMAPYLAPHAVDVGQGRRINLVCLGTGSPTVILSAGLGGWSVWWWPEQTVLAQRTQVCAWDRAGFGFSDPSPQTQDIIHTTEDLEDALRDARIPGPYVMVGHSLGGYESVRFADRHRASVVGMVLVDPAIPDQAALEERLAPRYATVAHAMLQGSLKDQQDCAAQLREGTLKPGTAPFFKCTAALDTLAPTLKARLEALNADPDRLLTQVSTNREGEAHDSREILNPQRSFGALPLIVLTAGRDEASIMSSLSALPLDTPGAATPEERAQLHQQVTRFLAEGWSREHAAYAALSKRGRHQIVADSGHNIPINKPDVVIAAINEVLDDLGSATSHGR